MCIRAVRAVLSQNVHIDLLPYIYLLSVRWIDYIYVANVKYKYVTPSNNSNGSEQQSCCVQDATYR